jgi:hypothetical protein
MSDYTKTTNFTAKDNLSTGDPLKVIKGSYFDTEFDNLATAVATKYDSGDLASQAQAEAETANTVLITPLRLANWADYNAGIVGDLQALADPAAHVLLGFDNTSNTAKAFVNATNGGVTLAAGTIGLDLSDLATDTSVGAAEFIVVQTDGSKKITLANFEALLTVTEAQISDLGTYYSSGDTPFFTAINVGHASDCTISRDGAGQLAIEGDAIFTHSSASYVSSKITFSTSAASGGASGDVWFQYTA